MAEQRFANVERCLVKCCFRFSGVLRSKSNRKRTKYKDLVGKKKLYNNNARFVNLSISMLSVLDESSNSSLDMLVQLGSHETREDYMIRNIVDITIRTS